MPLPNALYKESLKILYYYYQYKNSQRLSRSNLKNRQIRKLKKILYHAQKKVPYYSQLFRKMNFDINRINDIKDINRIPILKKEDIIKDPEKFIASNSKEFNSAWHYTSGTTGTPFSFLLDKNAELRRLASLLRCWNWTGYYPGKKVFSLQQGASLGFEGVKKLKKQKTIKLSATSLNKKNAIKTHKILLDYKPKYFISYPYSLVNFIKYGLEEFDNIHKPKVVISSGENLDNHIRNYIETNLNCKVFDFYSHEESVIMGMEDKDGIRYLLDDFGISEIVNEKTQKPVKSGEVGLLIGTGINNYSMPLIRYLVGDRIEIKSDLEDRKGKLNFTNYKRLLGRKNDVIYTPDGKKISILEDILHLKLDGIIASQIVQERINKVKLRIIKGPNFNEDNITKIREEMEKLISREMRYEFEFVDKLEIKKEGKIPFIISHLKNKRYEN